MSQLKTFRAFLNNSWKSYENCRKTLWWPYSFLLLTPLAVLVLAFVVPALMAKAGLFSDHFMDSKLYHGFLLLLFYSVAGLFIHACNLVCMRHIDGEAINENTGFVSIKMTWKTVLIFTGASLITCLGFVLSPFLGILAWLVFLLAATSASSSPTTSFKSILQTNLHLYKNHYGKIIGLGLARLLVLLVFISPLILFALFQHTPVGLRFLTALLAFPSMAYLFVRLLPFYVFLPNYFYKHMA
ncbi:hypothetical protein [Legionella genomosp. 1]|uniref:hypothetical protein n=1 Tax=Legionella genomosp. 1 TaxID=1093625 RepID=UPI00105664DD|nr:hypothetical protein [Legionella genomosp. 1]